MTNARTAKGEFMFATSKSPRTLNTVRLEHLVEESQRLAMGRRIADLRERSLWTQPQIAEMLGLTLRGYQKLEERGTTKYERAKEIAKIHDADADWIWDGRERKDSTPDVMAALSPSTGTDDEALALLHQILDQQSELLSRLELVRDEQERQRKLLRPSSRSRANKRS